jgi:predicted nucleotidyltransferase/predicted transcriptional regulator with HTH domain
MLSLRSELRRKLLAYFYASRSARVYVRQLAKALDVDSTNLSRELARLEREGLLRSEVEGRQRYYSINPQYPYLKAVFSLLQGTVGIVPTFKSALHRVRGIDQAYLYGSFAKNEADAASDIDLLIVGQPDPKNLAAEIRKLEKTLNREVNYTVLKSQELKRKLAAHDPFLTDVWQGKRIELIGNEQTGQRRHSDCVE